MVAWKGNNLAAMKVESSDELRVAASVVHSVETTVALTAGGLEQLWAAMTVALMAFVLVALMVGLKAYYSAESKAVLSAVSLVDQKVDSTAVLSAVMTVA